jgi:hypothetical protein
MIMCLISNQKQKKRSMYLHVYDKIKLRQPFQNGRNNCVHELYFINGRQSFQNYSSSTTVQWNHGNHLPCSTGHIGPLKKRRIYLKHSKDIHVMTWLLARSTSYVSQSHIYARLVIASNHVQTHVRATYFRDNQWPVWKLSPASVP